MAVAITLIIVALAAGYIGARIERRRFSSITKREATELRHDFDEMRVIFNEHWNTHKIIKYDIEILGHDVAVIGQTIGLDQPRSLH